MSKRDFKNGPTRKQSSQSTKKLGQTSNLSPWMRIAREVKEQIQEKDQGNEKEIDHNLVSDGEFNEFPLLSHSAYIEHVAKMNQKFSELGFGQTVSLRKKNGKKVRLKFLNTQLETYAIRDPKDSVTLPRKQLHDVVNKQQKITSGIKVDDNRKPLMIVGVSAVGTPSRRRYIP